jgi:NAD(P)-dependent dehydrogenase (short-subunit alcohol dehydrogenase family)
MDSGWNGQVALVTGGGRGIGRATARMLAAHGVAVGVNYAVRADTAEAVVAEIRGQGGRAVAIGGDVADAGAVAAMVARVEAELGPINILVNNAGIAWRATLESWEPKGYARLRAVNVDGVIHCIRAVMAGMRARGYGRIVNIASIAGLVTNSLPGNHFYAGTKAEMMVLTKRFALELGPHGITVNAVAPGYVRTDMNQGRLTEEEYQVRAADFAGRAITGRTGEPDDIANAVVFFAAPASGWITAQVLAVDGGRMDFIGHG